MHIRPPLLLPPCCKQDLPDVSPVVSFSPTFARTFSSKERRPGTRQKERVSVWCFIWIFVRHAFSLYLRIEALLLPYFSQFYDHLETLLLNLHNFLSTKNWNLFFKELGLQLTQIFRRKSKQDNNYCCPHRAATYFCLESV